MAAPMINAQFVDLLQKGLNEVFTVQRAELAADAVRPVLFNEETVDLAFMRNQEIGGLGNVPLFNGNIQYDSFGEGYQITYTNQRYAQGLSFIKDLIDDDQYGVIRQYPTKMAIAMERTMEVQGASLFSNAFNTTVFTGGNGQALCSNSQVYRNSGVAAQANKGTSALTYDNLITTRKLMKAFKDDRGQLLRVNPDLLLVPRGLEDVAIQLTQSPDQPNTANRSINPITAPRFMPGLSYIAWDYLTDSNDWFLIDTRLMKFYLHWYMREAPNFAIDPTSDFNLVWKVRASGRWSYGFDSWPWIFGQQVA